MGFNFDIINILILIVVILNSSLGILVLSTNTKSKIHQSFFIFCITATLWGLTMFLYREFAGVELGVLFSRMLYASAVLIPFSLIKFIKFFPNEKHNLPKILEIILIIPFLVVMLLSLIPDMLIHGIYVPNKGEPIINFNTTYHVIYALYIVGYFSICYAVMFFKYYKFTGLEKQQMAYIIFGTLVSTMIGVFTNLLMPLLDHFELNWVGQIGVFIMVASISYSIFQYKLFNTKIISTQLIVFILSTSLFARTLFSSNTNDLVINIVFLSITISVGLFLIKSVIKEVEQRDKIEMLAINLEKANLKLHELDKLKSEFLSLATHQIRAPLTAIKGYASMMSEGDYGELPPEAKNSSLIIEKSCQSLINIVNDFLNISRIEQGKMTYDLSDEKLDLIFSEVIEENRPNVESANLKLNIHIEEGIDYSIKTDRGKMKQIIGNIIDNATKYTKEGSIYASLRKESGKFKVSIKDTGLGIDPSEIDKLFSKFSRTKDANKVSVTGSGLGLYIAKRMINDLGGDIKVISEGLNKGAEFIIEI